MSAELLPCPFCGGVATITRGILTYVGCKPCLVAFGMHPELPNAEQQLIGYWNRRHAPAEVAAWQTMESAPKDGKEVLVLGTRAGIKNRIVVAHYMPGGFCIEDHPAIDEGWYYYSGGRFDRFAKPTHWQPLPTPPLAVTAETEPEAKTL